MTQEQFDKLNEVRKDSFLWKVIVANPNYDLDQKDRLYIKAFCLINIAYMFTEVQDWALRDFDDVIKACGLHTKQKTKKMFSTLHQHVKSAIYQCKELGEVKNDNGETQKYINGNGDILYDIARMLVDRLANKKDAIHVIAMLRTMENKNMVFPELDKGRYIVDI